MKKRFHSFRERVQSWQVPSILLNKYLFAFFVFAVWMTFFDKNNVFVQMQRIAELNSLTSQTQFYIEETATTKKQLYELQHNQRALEKFAREKYYMKKPDEDIFVIIED